MTVRLTMTGDPENLRFGAEIFPALNSEYTAGHLVRRLQEFNPYSISFMTGSIPLRPRRGDE